MAKKLKKTIEFEGGPIRTTNRFFIQLKGYGLADDKEKTVLGMGLSTKKICAEPDSPLALICALIEEFRPLFKYTSHELMEKDALRLKKLADHYYECSKNTTSKKGESK